MLLAVRPPKNSLWRAWCACTAVIAPGPALLATLSRDAQPAFHLYCTVASHSPQVASEDVRLGGCDTARVHVREIEAHRHAADEKLGTFTPVSRAKGRDRAMEGCWKERERIERERIKREVCAEALLPGRAADDEAGGGAAARHARAHAAA